MKKAILLISCILVTGCTSENDARRALDNAGYTDVRVEGYDLWGCSEDDFFRTKFTAKNTNGQFVKGTVCSGLLFKGATIRF